MSLPTDQEINEAIKRLALTADGQLLYRRLQMILMDVPPTADVSALQQHTGRRHLARELKLLMDEELAKVASERDRRSGEHDPDRPAVVEPARAVSLERPGLRRRVAGYPDPA